MARPDFAQFAEICRHTLEQADQSGLSAESPFTWHAFATAERHARLLETIREWAENPKPGEYFDAVCEIREILAKE